jgi:hypothetical protein
VSQFSTESDIVAAYTSRNPTRLNSREIVAEIANEFGATAPKIRSVLVKSGVYIALPKKKSSIEEKDYDGIIHEFHHHIEINGISDDYFGPDDLMSKISNDFGYGKWTVSEFYREFKDLELPHSSEQFLIAVKERSIRREQDWNQRISDQIEIDRSARGLPPLSSTSRKGPDFWGWVFIIGISLAVATCIQISDPDSGKSENQKTAEKLCEVMGGCE